MVNNVKAVQRLTGRIAALGRFISRSSDRSHHFSSLLKKKISFEWTPECQHALEELKRYLSSPPLLHTPKEDETLYLYLAVSEVIVSGVLVWEEQGAQFLVYYVSQTLGDAETRHSIKTPKFTNNEAEYEAIIVGLELAKSLGEEIVEAKCDSLLVILHRFKEWTLVHISREQNSEADSLANLGSSVEEDDILPGAVVRLSKLVIEEGHAEVNSTSLTWDWRNKYIDYLKNGKLPTDPKESRALRAKAARFSLHESGTLYRRTFDGPLAVCLGPGDTDYVL
ncbi:PREDICTED: uncharacterized protein LOC109244305 [Nicotiana attenuata]|uniref:uncharacterized protein LOC109244305 n=1 Tax=Nicotiana attenuata TaxID=49451 RepID=UPI000905B4C9|nr:PREDICTED: uncharacterized protein LOC109244305 [Nicotiana attenuata]